MADTKRGNFQDKECSDCGEKICTFIHWGDLVFKGEVGSFCPFCWKERNESYIRGEAPKPLGVKPPGLPTEFLGKKVKVATQSGSVYELALTEKEEERIVFCNRRKVHFTRARVICLAIGKGLFLKPRDGNIQDLFWTSPVVSIESIN